MSKSVLRAPGLADYDAIEAQALIDWHRQCPTQIGNEHEFRCIAIGRGCAISLPPAGGPVFNRILGLSTSDELEQAYSWMQERRAAGYLQLDRERASPDVKRWMVARKLVEKGSAWAKLIAVSGALDRPSSPLKCRAVRSDEADLFGTLVCTGFGMNETLGRVWASIVGKEGWSCFFAMDGDRAIGTGAMYSSGDQSWLGAGTTLPAFRGHGVHKALIQARLDAGIARGSTTFVVEATTSSTETDISLNNLKRCGFHHLYTRRNFAL